VPHPPHLHATSSPYTTLFRSLYHSQSLEAMFNNQPGLKIVMPSTPYDAKGLLKASIRDNDPVLFLEHKRAYRLLKEDLPEKDYRSEEHTSELQSRFDLVCRLL